MTASTPQRLGRSSGAKRASRACGKPRLETRRATNSSVATIFGAGAFHDPMSDSLRRRANTDEKGRPLATPMVPIITGSGLVFAAGLAIDAGLVEPIGQTAGGIVGLVAVVAGVVFFCLIEAL